MVLSVSSNNGTAPASALSAMPGRNGDGSQQTSPTATAQSYARLRAAMVAAGLGDLVPSDGYSCYRDRAAQQHMRNIGLTTIPVGQSIHGEWSNGGAVDFANLGGFGAARHNWLRQNGGPHGWYQPAWAQAGGSLPEPWHWEHDARNDQHAGETPPGGGGFLMALTDAQQDQLFNEVMNLRGWIWAGGPDVNAGAADPGSISARTIHMDQVLAGAQATPGNALGRIMNIDQQVAGADGFESSVAARVINIEDATVPPPTSVHSHGSSLRGVVAIILAAFLGLSFLALVILNGVSPENLPEDASDWIATAGGALVGALAVYLGRGGHRHHEDEDE